MSRKRPAETPLERERTLDIFEVRINRMKEGITTILTKITEDLPPNSEFANRLKTFATAWMVMKPFISLDTMIKKAEPFAHLSNLLRLINVKVIHDFDMFESETLARIQTILKAAIDVYRGAVCLTVLAAENKEIEHEKSLEELLASYEAEGDTVNERMKHFQTSEYGRMFENITTEICQKFIVVEPVVQDHTPSESEVVSESEAKPAE